MIVPISSFAENLEDRNKARIKLITFKKEKKKEKRIDDARTRLK
jgi:hypothetical protein